MKLALILVNLIAAFIAFGSARITGKSNIHSVMSVYEALDKDGMINRVKAAELFPGKDLNGHEKYDIPVHYMNETTRTGFTPVGALRLHNSLACLFTLNALFVALFMKEKRKAEPSGGAYGSPAAGSPSAHP